jgi:acyl carrier protein
MEKLQVIAELNRIFISVFKHDNFEMKSDLSANDVEGWDSLSHMLIISEIENIFSIKLKLKDLNKMRNVGDMVDIIISKL